MQKLRVAAVAMNSALGNSDRNLAAIELWTREAAADGAELVLFPELIVQGHCDPRAWYNAEAVPAGPATRFLSDLAQRHGIYLSAGLAERADDFVYNTQILAGPSGFVGSQRKLHLSRDELIHYNGGSAVQVFDIGKCKVGVSICYDNWFPEVPRLLALRGADVILMPHASRMKMWTDDPSSEREAAECIRDFFLRHYATRAFENACFAVVCNQAGRSGYLDCYPPGSPNQPHHAGGAAVFDPLGNVVVSTKANAVREEMLVADLDPERTAEARSDPNYQLRRRRAELFRDLAR